MMQDHDFERAITLNGTLGEYRQNAITASRYRLVRDSRLWVAACRDERAPAPVGAFAERVTLAPA